MTQHCYCLSSSCSAFTSDHVSVGFVAHWKACPPAPPHALLSCRLQGKYDKILAPVITLDFKQKEAMEAIKKPAALSD